MYTPKVFEETRTAVLHRAIRDAGVGVVVSHGAGGLVATHVPMELDAAAGGQGVLRCHFARPNPHGALLDGEPELLAIFTGPQGYVTPSWYPAKAEHGKVVPTWNYAAVHVYGVGAAFEDPAKLRAHLDALTAHFEARGGARAAPWRIDDAPPEFVARMMGGIVGVEIRITRLEGKWKMSQNRPPPDRIGVVDGLRARGADGDAALAEAIEAAPGPEPG